MKKIVLAALVVASLAQGCVSKSEYARNVEAWRDYYEATRPDLVKIYEGLPEPSRSTRLDTVEQQGQTIAAAESRSGARPASERRK